MTHLNEVLPPEKIQLVKQFFKDPRNKNKKNISLQKAAQLGLGNHIQSIDRDLSVHLRLPEKISKNHLQANNKLISDEHIAKIKSYFEKNRGINKLSRKEAIKALGINIDFSVVKFEDGKLAALYQGKARKKPGFEQDRKLGTGNFGAVKYGQMLEGYGEWIAIKAQKPKATETNEAEWEQGIVSEEKKLGSDLKGKSRRRRKENSQLVAYTAMELGWGKDLSKFIAINKMGNNLLSTADKIDMTVESLKALHAMHEAQQLHRDIKLENMMWDPQTRLAKLVDFGLVVNLDENQSFVENLAPIGSEGYMAPDIKQSGGLSKYDVNTDNYSIGCVVSELWNPFVRTEDPQWHSKFSENYRDLLNHYRIEINNVNQIQRRAADFLGDHPETQNKLTVIERVFSEVARDLINPNPKERCMLDEAILRVKAAQRLYRTHEKLIKVLKSSPEVNVTSLLTNETSTLQEAAGKLVKISHQHQDKIPKALLNEIASVNKTINRVQAIQRKNKISRLNEMLLDNIKENENNSTLVPILKKYQNELSNGSSNIDDLEKSMKNEMVFQVKIKILTQGSEALSAAINNIQDSQFDLSSLKAESLRIQDLITTAKKDQTLNPDIDQSLAKATQHLNNINKCIKGNLLEKTNDSLNKLSTIVSFCRALAEISGNDKSGINQLNIDADVVEQIIKNALMQEMNGSMTLPEYAIYIDNLVSGGVTSSLSSFDEAKKRVNKRHPSLKVPSSIQEVDHEKLQEFIKDSIKLKRSPLSSMKAHASRIPNIVPKITRKATSEFLSLFHAKLDPSVVNQAITNYIDGDTTAKADRLVELKEFKSRSRNEFNRILENYMKKVDADMKKEKPDFDNLRKAIEGLRELDKNRFMGQNNQVRLTAMSLDFYAKARAHERSQKPKHK